MFMVGIGIFTGGSVLAALAPNISLLIVARAIQGFGGAIVDPTHADHLVGRRTAGAARLALGVWSGVGCLAIAIGP